MTDKTVVLPLPVIVQQLRKLTDKGATGTVIIATMDNRVIRIAIQDGEFVSIVFQKTRGIEAIREIRTIDQGRVGFSKGVVLAGDDDQALPPRDVVLQMLAGQESNMVTQTGSFKLIDTKTLRAISTRELIEIMGPMAEVLCDEVFSGLGEQIESSKVSGLLSKMLRSVGDNRQAEELRKRIMEQLS